METFEEAYLALDVAIRKFSAGERKPNPDALAELEQAKRVLKELAYPEPELVRYYADLNVRYQPGDRFEKRYVIIDIKDLRVVPSDVAPQYTSLRAAERRAQQLNDLEIARSKKG